MILQQQTTQLGGSSLYGAGLYDVGIYGGSANNAVVFNPMQGEIWDVDYVVCACTSQSFTQFSVYLNTLDQTGLIGNTINGNADSVPIPETIIRSGDILVGVWFGGDSGAQAVASINGGIFEPE